MANSERFKLVRQVATHPNPYPNPNANPNPHPNQVANKTNDIAGDGTTIAALTPSP